MKARNISSLFLIGTLATLSISSLISVRPAQAGWSDLDPFNRNGGLRRGLRNADPTNPNSAAGQTLRNPTFRSFNIHVKNNSNQPIEVNIRWYVQPDGSESCIQQVGVDCDDDAWKTAYWVLQPGEKAFVVDDADSRYAYFSARSLDGTIVWESKQVDMGSTYGNYNYNFNY